MKKTDDDMIKFFDEINSAPSALDDLVFDNFYGYSGIPKTELIINHAIKNNLDVLQMDITTGERVPYQLSLIFK